MGWYRDALTLAGILPPGSHQHVVTPASCSAFSLQQALHNQMITAVQEISNLIEPVASAARAEASQLGHKVTRGWETADEVLGVCGEAHGGRRGTR